MKCYFQPIPLSPPRSPELKSYSSIILKDKTSCPDTDFNCIYSTTSYLYTNQQIGCYTPAIPLNDQTDFNEEVDYYVTLVYGDNLQITCSTMTKCRVKFGKKNSAVINYINSNNFYAGFKPTFRVEHQNNSIENLNSIKVKFFYLIFLKLKNLF
jgi:hypothetical protein